MSKKRIVGELARRGLIPRGEADVAFQAFVAIVHEALGRGDRVILQGLGVLKVVNAADRMGRNPKTGEPCLIPAHRRVRFLPCKEVKVL